MLRNARNADAASWIESRLHSFAVDVGSIIPDGFAAYARVFHPPYRRTPEGNETRVRWRDIAAANHRTLAAEMQLMDISSCPSNVSASGEVLWNEKPNIGDLPREIAARLAAILPAHTRSPDCCWFAVWEGFADLRAPIRGAPMFSVPERNLFLLDGILDDVLTTLSETDWIHRSPNLWWPDDQSWCVATEIDFRWSYVGGSRACIEQILGDPELEAIPTRPDEGNVMQSRGWEREMWARPGLASRDDG
jgi:hypothetical protein